VVKEPESAYYTLSRYDGDPIIPETIYGWLGFETLLGELRDMS
jgi:hypothetical protein